MRILLVLFFLHQAMSFSSPQPRRLRNLFAKRSPLTFKVTNPWLSALSLQDPRLEDEEENMSSAKKTFIEALNSLG
ncbi:Oidioi.mRNA.OKI2018_I69.chr2.g4289.t1.cds [Oikopleura dioica]|uniref:Oidioi.mRNA.OKI2018_I69.chr2.g4289.t1.cds n=1 Tax=Oikopleura dioica TaxID=34765 RepID=A0ABN7T0C3_OIKDI|nr:Oidioi.mRNA.OKI2018_I69.chr2.g4289.t1.cds [Oikopleura dioica]